MDRRVSTDLAGPLGRVLSDLWATRVTVTDAAVITAGARRLNAVFTADVDGETRRLVLTLLPQGAEAHNTLTAEAEMVATAERWGVKVPHVECSSDDASPLGGPFMITSFVGGETVPRRVLRLVDERGHGDRVVEEIGASLAALHAIPVDEAPVGLQRAELDDPIDEAILGLTARLDELPVRRPAIELGLRWMAEHRPPRPDRTTIVHGDVRNGNIIVDDEGLAAILDWEIASVGGDPMHDLAWTAARMWRGRNDAVEIGGMAQREALITGYERAGGTYDEARFEWWKVSRAVWWALGLAHQAESFLDGSVPSIVMAASGRRVSELEWDLLMLIAP
jgi:aminoglycoside phosphotransferase (APT) family kinase protein